MMGRILFTISGLLFLTTTVHAQSCGTGNRVENPETFSWTQVNTSSETYYFGVLEMGAAEFTINGETLITRAYRQEGGAYSIPGPTIRMEPGKKYVLRFKNTLPYEPFNHEHNVFKNPNVTNVHTHGLHISGESPGDDVTRFFEGGFGGDYVYDIPANHMGGGYWYHAHHHGATFLQVSTGAFGLIFIENDPQEAIPANVAAMEERHLVLGYLEPNNAAGTGGDTLIGGTFSDGWTINGTVNGDVCVPQGEWQNWRMLVADQDARLVDLQIGDGCEVALMARDGVWRTEAPKILTDNTLTLTGASRADLAVRCNSNSTISVAGTQVANVIIEGTSNSTAHPYDEDGVSTWSAVRPDYLRDLRQEPFVAGSQTIRMGARTVLGRRFDPDVPNIEETADGVQEWTVRGAANHPFHLHIYHVQVQADCGPYEAGEFYDVIAGNCDLRFDMSDAEAYEGRTIMHCHILEHEDQGAMAWMDVTGGAPPPEFPNDEGFMFYDYYQFDGGGTGGTPPAAPSNLAATAASDSRIDLDWLDNSGNETSFRIERSPDGASFSPLTSVAADVTSYSDSGLSPLTTYYYRVLAANADGDSGYSNVASDTTQAGGGTATDLVVQSVVVSTQNAARGARFGRADVRIVDNLGNPVDGALVDGEFTDQIIESVVNAQTDANGDVTMVTSDSAKPLNTLTFCVTNVTADGLTFAGPDVCGSL
jgi:FtsP/CotA-like multicopper oxidase with cupredoxin domain